MPGVEVSKFETFTACRAEQRLCLEGAGKPSEHRSSNFLICHVIYLVQSLLISSHISHLISSHFIQFHFISFHLIRSLLISPRISHLIWSNLFSFHLTSHISSYVISCHVIFSKPFSHHYLILCPFTLSLLFSNHPSSSQLTSTVFSFSHVILACLIISFYFLSTHPLELLYSLLCSFSFLTSHRSSFPTCDTLQHFFFSMQTTDVQLGSWVPARSTTLHAIKHLACKMWGPLRAAGTQSVLDNHNSIIQAIQDGMPFVDVAADDEANKTVRQRHIDLFEFSCGPWQTAMCFSNARSLIRGGVGIEAKDWWPCMDWSRRPATAHRCSDRWKQKPMLWLQFHLRWCCHACCRGDVQQGKTLTHWPR